MSGYGRSQAGTPDYGEHDRYVATARSRAPATASDGMTHYTMTSRGDHIFVKEKVQKIPARMWCCHVITGAAILGALQAMIVVFMLSASAIVLDRWRFWERLPYDPDWQTQTIATTTIAPVVPYLAVFDPNGPKVEVGWSMTLSGSVTATASSFNIDLNCGSDNSQDVPLHFNPRFVAPIHIARNTRRATVYDANEEQDGGMGGLAQGAVFVIRIEVMQSYYEISIGIGGGALTKFATYNHRTSYECISSVQITGDITSPFNVQYYWPNSQADVDNFAEAWLEFALSHNIAFLAVWLITLVPYALTFWFHEEFYLIPNLLMIGLGIFAVLIALISCIIRITWPSSRYETDEFQEAALVYLMIFLCFWWLFLIIIGWYVYQFYRWLELTEVESPAYRWEREHDHKLVNDRESRKGNREEY